MEFNFNIEKTAVLKSLTLASFPLLKYAKPLSRLFLWLGIFSLLLIPFSYFGLLLESTAIKILLLNVILWLLFFELYLFTELKIKKYHLPALLRDAVANQDNQYNLAEFLSLEACHIVQGAYALAKKSKFSEITSDLLFYASIKDANCALMLTHLGINVLQLRHDLKNHLEKQLRREAGKASFSTSFQKTIYGAANLAVARGKQYITEKELLINLARHSTFFKEVLVKYDLKEKQTKDMIFWLDEIEEKNKKSKQFWTKENLAKIKFFGKGGSAKASTPEGGK